MKKEKQYLYRRRKLNNEAVSVSIKIYEKTLSALKKEVENKKNQSMSEIVENIVSKNISEKISFDRKPRGCFPVRKTLTFSPDFVKALIKKTKNKNKSDFIDSALQKYFKI